jgi:hypothetical protein
MCECHSVISQFAHVATLKDAMQRRDDISRKFANTTLSEFETVYTVFRTAVVAVLRQPLSEEDYLTLADRLAALVQKVTTTCEELADAEDYGAVTVLGDKLNELKALDVSTLPSSNRCSTTVSSSEFAQARGRSYAMVRLAAKCNALFTQFANSTHTREAIQHRDELQNTVTALRAARSDFIAVGQAGKALKAARAVIAQLPLSEEDYLTLADRHAELVQKVTTTCAELADAGEIDTVDSMAATLKELQALDVSALQQSCANDPVPPPAPPAVKGEEGRANDPAYVPPAPGASSQQGTVPPACTAIPATAEEGEEEWANDPAHVPPAPGASSQQGTVPPAWRAIAATAEEGEEEWANDPAHVPPAPGASSQQGTVPPACTAIPATAEEGEEEWANDPAHVPPAPGASSQQGTVPPAWRAIAATAEEGEEDRANDPVYVPPAPDVPQPGTVPPACTAISVTAEEEVEEWANDPVYVPPAADETTLA